MITQENIPYTADEIKAMVKTCEKYNKVLERAREQYNKRVPLYDIESIFPELKESEDERIRKGLIKAVSGILKGNTLYGTDVTREEEIARASKDNHIKRHHDFTFGEYVAFIDGAKWADQHPDIDVRTMAAWSGGYKEAIEKACEWLSAELDKEEKRHYIHVHGFDKERREIFLEDFRKAMKGE